MAKFASTNLQKFGPQYMVDNGTKMLLLKAYTLGDNYATVTGNAISSATVAGTDYAFTAADGIVTLHLPTGKSATASESSGAAPNLHFAITDDTSEVIYVTDETTDQVITSGNLIVYPALTYEIDQPE